MPAPAKMERILLKVSGEALSGEGAQGIDPACLGWLAGQIRRAGGSGRALAVVVGGGNIIRGGPLAKRGGVGRYAADTMGMLGTAINAIALTEALRAAGAPAAAMTAIDVPAYIERYHPEAAGAHLDAGRIVVLAGGVGNPFFTTDTTACLRAAELGCSRVLKATKVNGVFDADPRTHPGASRFDTLTATEAVNRRLGVMDLTAMTLAIENRLPIVVFDFATEGNIGRAAAGERVGTLITPD